MSVSFSTDTNPANFKWFLHGQEGCFTHKGHAEQHFDGVVRLPKKLKPKNELAIAKDIMIVWFTPAKIFGNASGI